MRSASRWIYVAVGCVVLLFSGLVYAWSVLSGPIAAEFPRWTTAQLSLTFTIVMSLYRRYASTLAGTRSVAHDTV